MRRMRAVLLALWPVAGLLLLLSRICPMFAEQVFARGLYPVWHSGLSFLSGLLPFSLAELLVYAAVPAAVLLLAGWAVRMVRVRGAFWQGGLNLLALGGLIFFLFQMGCGANYYRATYLENSGLTASGGTAQELYDLCADLAERTAAARAELADCEDADGVFRLPYSLDTLGTQAQQAANGLRQEGILRGYLARPKCVLWSRGMSRLGIVGMYFPFTGEANVNVDPPDYGIGDAMCHELAHMGGYMREDEANYLSYLACTRYGDRVLRYSGLMSALIYAGNALYEADPARYYALRATYADGIDRDLRDNAAYWAQFDDKPASEFGEKMNDTYLKANNQPQGTRSYGEMVDLLLAEYLNKQPPES